MNELCYVLDIEQELLSLENNYTLPDGQVIIGRGLLFQPLGSWGWSALIFTY
jgi:hypothetical protein